MLFELNLFIEKILFSCGPRCVAVVKLPTSEVRCSNPSIDKINEKILTIQKLERFETNFSPEMHFFEFAASSTIFFISCLNDNLMKFSKTRSSLTFKTFYLRILVWLKKCYCSYELFLWYTVSQFKNSKFKMTILI